MLASHRRNAMFIIKERSLLTVLVVLTFAGLFAATGLTIT
jgi:hypothetical protein